VLRDDRSPDARTINVCIAPFGEVAVVDDGAGPYKETIVPGAFRDQVEARSTPLRLWLDLEHQKNTVIGHATGLRELDGGLYGAFAVHPGVVGDKVLDRHPRRHAHQCLDEGDPDPLARGRRRHSPPESPPHWCLPRRPLGLLRSEGVRDPQSNTQRAGRACLGRGVHLVGSGAARWEATVAPDAVLG
jgi:hypothetical protein